MAFPLSSPIQMLDAYPWFEDMYFETKELAEASLIKHESKIFYVADQSSPWSVYDSEGNVVPFKGDTSAILDQINTLSDKKVTGISFDSGTSTLTLTYEDTTTLTANMSHTHASTEVTEATAMPRVGAAANATQSTVNAKVNTALKSAPLNTEVDSGQALIDGFTLTLLDAIDIYRYVADSAATEDYTTFLKLNGAFAAGRSPVALIKNTSTYNITVSVSGTMRNNGVTYELVSDNFTFNYDDDNIVLEPGDVLMLRYNFWTSSLVTCISNVIKSTEKYVEQTPTGIAQATIDILLDEANWSDTLFDYVDQTPSELGLFPGMEIWGESAKYAYFVRDDGVYRSFKSHQLVVESIDISGRNTEDPTSVNVTIGDNTERCVFSIINTTQDQESYYTTCNILLPIASKLLTKALDVLFDINNSVGATVETVVNICYADGTVIQAITVGNAYSIKSDGTNIYVK